MITFSTEFLRTRFLWILWIYSLCNLRYMYYYVSIPPGNNERDLHKMLDCISLISSNGDLLLLGDFHAPDVNRSTLTASSTRSPALCECIINKNLIQMVTGLTHHLRIHVGNTLDVILRNCPDRVSNILVHHEPTSAHYRISFHVKEGNSYSIIELKVAPYPN